MLGANTIFCVICGKPYEPYMGLSPHAKIAVGFNPINPNEVHESRYCPGCYKDQIFLRESVGEHSSDQDGGDV